MDGTRLTVFMFDPAGNDSDGEEKPVVPVKTVEKTTMRTSKRNVEPTPPTRGPTGSRRGGGPGGNEGGTSTVLVFSSPRLPGDRAIR